MYTIRNAAPRAILNGIKDESGRTPVYEPEALPTHLPHVYLFSQKGPTLPQLVSGDDMVRMFGSKTFDERSKYFTHQTVLAKVVNAEGNKMMVQRVVPPGANPPATLRLSVDIMPELVPQYERDAEGRFVLDANGAKVPTGTTVPGHVVRWVVGPATQFGLDLFDGRLLENDDPRLLENDESRILESGLGTGSAMVGTMTNSFGEQSMIYPIMDFQVTDFGSYGNLMGVRISAPTTRDDIPLDDTTVLEQLAYLYRVQFVERADENSTPKVLETLWGDQYVDFSFKEGVVNTRTNTELFIDQAVIPSYHQEAAAGMPEIRPPFSRIHVYDAQLEEVLTMLQSEEHKYGLVSDSAEHLHLVNPMTATDHNGIPYYSVLVYGPADDGVLLTASSTHYAQGGFDGNMSYATFDSAVRYQLANYGDLEAKLMDSAVYPQSILYDTGFSIETKKAFAVPMGRRKDICVMVSTQDVTQPQNTPSEDSSIAIALRAALRMYPESVIFGTATCRALVVGRSGYLLNNSYKGLLPLTIQLARNAAKYMGASNGIWKAGLAFDMPGNNLVTMFHKVNAQWTSINARSRDWDNGLVWVQNYDRHSLFFPGIQTVYDDDTSVLNSAITMMVAVELQKVAERTWRDLTGISSLTPEQFVERSDRLIEERVRGRFDNRVIIVPETYYTQNDEQRGFSWSTNIHMYAANMKTVGTFTIVARRIEDYAA